jgi:hypothetical protein
MKGDPQFTLYWKTGQRQLVEGRTIAEAMTLAGYSAGAAPALDFWAKGDNHRYIWDAAEREWNSLDVAEMVVRNPVGKIPEIVAKYRALLAAHSDPTTL